MQPVAACSQHRDQREHSYQAGQGRQEFVTFSKEQRRPDDGVGQPTVDHFPLAPPFGEKEWVGTVTAGADGADMLEVADSRISGCGHNVGGTQAVHQVEGQTAGRANDRHQVHHSLHVVEGGRQRLGFQDVPVMYFHEPVVEQTLPSRDVDQATDLVPPTEQFLDHPPTEEAGGAGHQSQQVILPPPLTANTSINKSPKSTV